MCVPVPKCHPLTTPGLCPLDPRWELHPQTPVIGSRYTALAIPTADPTFPSLASPPNTTMREGTTSDKGWCKENRAVLYKIFPENVCRHNNDFTVQTVSETCVHCVYHSDLWHCKRRLYSDQWSAVTVRATLTRSISNSVILTRTGSHSVLHYSNCNTVISRVKSHQSRLKPALTRRSNPRWQRSFNLAHPVDVHVQKSRMEDLKLQKPLFIVRLFIYLKLLS